MSSTLWIVLGISLILLLSTVVVVVLVLMVKWQRQQEERQTEGLKLLNQNNRGQLELLDKTVALLASRDTLAYQQIQVMGASSGYDDAQAYDPSDAGEIERIKHESPLSADQGDLTDYEQQISAEFGIDSSYLGTN
jgi:hypothetical protein